MYLPTMNIDSFAWSLSSTSFVAVGTFGIVLLGTFSRVAFKEDAALVAFKEDAAFVASSQLFVHTGVPRRGRRRRVQIGMWRRRNNRFIATRRRGRRRQVQIGVWRRRNNQFIATRRRGRRRQVQNSVWRRGNNQCIATQRPRQIKTSKSCAQALTQKISWITRVT